MKKTLTLALMLALQGCGGGSGGSTQNTGSTTVSVSLSGLSGVTAVSATLSQPGYPSITQVLSISGASASATVPQLATGLWHVSVLAYAGSALAYAGATDTSIDKNSATASSVSLSPAAVLGSAGSALPGQYLPNIFYDATNAAFDVVDAGAGTGHIYDASTFSLSSSLTLPAHPSALALASGGTGLLAGYSNGTLLNVAGSGNTTLATVPAGISALLPLGNYLVIASNASTPASVATLNLGSGTVAASETSPAPLGALVTNGNTVYALSSATPNSAYHFSVNSSNGTLGAVSAASQSSASPLAAPLALLPSQNLLLSASGDKYGTSATPASDLAYQGNVGATFTDIAVDDSLGYAYLIGASPSYPLLAVLKEADLSLAQALSLPAPPSRVLETSNSIVVFMVISGQLVAQTMSLDAGLTPTGRSGPANCYTTGYFC